MKLKDTTWSAELTICTLTSPPSSSVEPLSTVGKTLVDDGIVVVTDTDGSVRSTVMVMELDSSDLLSAASIANAMTKLQPSNSD